MSIGGLSIYPQFRIGIGRYELRLLSPRLSSLIWDNNSRILGILVHNPQPFCSSNILRESS